MSYYFSPLAKNEEGEEIAAWFEVNLQTRRVNFCYRLDSEGGLYVFSLLSECRDDIALFLSKLLKESSIQTMVVEDYLDYYTIVTNSNDSEMIFER